MVINDPCAVCKRSVHRNHRSVQCDLCHLWVHIGCNNITPSSYEDLITENNNADIPENKKTKFLCNTCLNNEFPFGNQSHNTFHSTNSLGLNTDSNIENFEITLDHTTKNQIKQISQLILENTDPENANTNFCQYYSIEKFNKIKPMSKNNFSVFHLNIASLQYHLEDLKILLSSLKTKFDIISISETKLHKNTPPNIDINIENYQYEHTPTEAEKGGTLIYVSNKHDYKPRKDLEIYESKNIESTFIEIIKPNEKNTIIGSIYRHHTISKKDFNDAINPILIKLSKENKHCYLTGDFNMNLLSITKETDIENFFEQLTDKQFMPLITAPTRVTSKSKTLIDNIFYNQFSNSLLSGNITTGISDHMPQFCIIPINSKYSNKHAKNVYQRKFKNFDSNKYNEDLNKIDWSIGDNEDVHQYAANLIHINEQLLDIHAPFSKLSNKQLKQRDKPWIDREILNKIKTKNNLYKKFIKENNQSLKHQFESDYKSIKNDITKLIRQKKKHYYQIYFHNNSQNAKQMWAGVNEIIKTKTSHQFTPNCIEQNVNGTKTTLTNPKEMANAFNNHYVNVANKILKRRKFPGNKHFTHYMENTNAHTFMTTPTTPNEIEDLIKVSDSSKSTGPNSIPNKIIKSISKTISIPISILCNQSFSSGVYPNILKISKVIPIYKKDSKLEVENYRPISLLSNINKILEKLMFKRLYSFFELYNCIYELQFGFREKHSTNHALLSMTQQIREAMDNGDIAIGVFVDFQKAFDTVNHDILIRKLEHYGVRGTPNHWFKSYLTGRTQYVSLSGSLSDHAPIEHGVPQGSVLGPLLFLVYINDLHTCIKHSTTRHFADDTNLLHILNKKARNSNITRNLNYDLKFLNIWLLANKISLNAKKTELIFFRRKGTPIPVNKIKLNGVKLKSCSEIKYVGITFDEHLTFEPHRLLLNSKLKRANNLISISRHYVPKETLLQIYYGQVYSHLTFGCQLWGMNDNDNLKTLTQQKKAIRKIYFAQFDAHSDPLFKELGLLKLPDLIKLNNIIFVHNVLNNKIPKHFTHFFQTMEIHHNHNLVRNPNSQYSTPRGSLILPEINNLHIGTKTIKYTCANTWNNTLKELCRKNPLLANDENWLKDKSVSQIKRLLKDHFLEQY